MAYFPDRLQRQFGQTQGIPILHNFQVSPLSQRLIERLQTRWNTRTRYPIAPLRGPPAVPNYVEWLQAQEEWTFVCSPTASFRFIVLCVFLLFCQFVVCFLVSLLILLWINSWFGFIPEMLIKRNKMHAGLSMYACVFIFLFSRQLSFKESSWLSSISRLGLKTYHWKIDQNIIKKFLIWL